MSEKQTFLGKLVEKLGNFIKGIFDAAEREYGKLQPDVQKALVKGSEVLKIINDNVEKAPDFVITLIQKAVPSLDRDKLLEGLNKVAEGLNVVEAIEADTLEGTIANLQKYLASKKGETWAAVTSLAAKLFAFFLAPKGTKYDVFESLMLFVYQTFVKPKK